MRGDFINVTYRTGVGTDKTKVTADRAGSEVIFSVDRQWVIVSELDRSGKEINRAQFAASEVVAITKGHEKNGTRRKK